MDTPFTYQGWSFRMDDQRNLVITPGLAESGGSQVFGEPKSTSASDIKPIQIPHEEVYRLLGYCLTGELGNTQVIQQVKELEKTAVAH